MSPKCPALKARASSFHNKTPSQLEQKILVLVLLTGMLVACASAAQTDARGSVVCCSADDTVRPQGEDLSMEEGMVVRFAYAQSILVTLHCNGRSGGGNSVIARGAEFLFESIAA